MKIEFKTSVPENLGQSCFIVGLFEDGTSCPASTTGPQFMHHAIAKLTKQGGFKGKIGSTLLIYAQNKDELLPVVLVGCGKDKELTPPRFRTLALAAFHALSTLPVSSALCTLQELNVANQDLSWKIKQITEAAVETQYQFNQFKTEAVSPSKLKEVIICLDDKKQQKSCESAAKQGLAIAQAVAWTKNLANLPSNICTPTYLAEQAKELAKSYKALTVNILGEKEMKKLGMGALLGVSKGSEEEAQLICLEYKGGSAKQKPIALVGKGVTFDTGGNSIKSADAMVGMKYDMSGAATVLGVMQAAAELALPLNIIGIAAAVENMPGGSAYKPEDILVSLSGQTIEVISTDAEGRLALADALTYSERYHPEIVIDIATLTGAIVIALGTHASGLMSNNQPLANDLLKAGEESNDRAWQLPLWEEYHEQIKSPFADMSNVGGRPAGSITAGCFLSRFAKSVPWAHLDVAGTAAVMFGTSDRKATGRPVPLLTQYLINKATCK